MTLLVRSFQTLTQATLQPRLRSLGEPLRHSFRVLPIDVDVFRHMNHAKYLNYLEAARWGLMVRTGFFGLALRRGWIGPIAKVHIEYYRPLVAFQKFEITTQFVRFETKWCHILQRFWSGEKEMARALVTGTIRRRRDNVPPSEYLTPLGFLPEQASVPAEVAEWVSSRLDLLSADGAAAKSSAFRVGTR